KAAVEPKSHLVVGITRHQSSLAALHRGMDLAVRLDAFLHVAHIVDADDLPVDPDRDDWDEAIADAVRRERRHACDLLASLPGNWAYYSRPGNPAELLMLLADANDAEMIIIGTSRGGMLSRMERFLGESVSEKLVHRTRRPVLLVPAETSG